MNNLKLYVNHKLYDFSRGLLDWAVKKQYWKLAGRISGWRNRLVIPILEELHKKFIVTPPPVVLPKEEPTPAKTKSSKKKIQRVKRSVR